MAQPYVGEIRLFAGNFAPAGWMFCDGSTLPISENDTLFNLIGTTYGGDGQETFCLPNLASRLPIHMGAGASLSSRQLGEAVGTESVTLTTAQTPVHTHALLGSASAGSQSSPAGNFLAQGARGVMMFGANTPSAQLAPTALSSTGGTQPHENMQPYVCVNYIISLYGIYPSQ